MVYGFRDRRTAVQLKRLADQVLNRPASVMQVETGKRRANSQVTYICWPATQITAAEYRSGTWHLGTGMAWIQQRHQVQDAANYYEAQTGEDLDLRPIQCDEDQFIKVRVYNRSTEPIPAVTMPLSGDPDPPLLAIQDTYGDLYLDSPGTDSRPFPDLLVVAILEEVLLPQTGTSTVGPGLVDGHTVVLHGTIAGRTLLDIQIGAVANPLALWAPIGSHVIASAHDTGMVTTGQTPSTNNGLPIYDLAIIAVEPPEFTIELELDDDLPPVRQPEDIEYLEVAGRPFQNIWGICNRDEFLDGDKATFNPALLTANKGQPVIATVRRKQRPLPVASPGEHTEWLVTIMAVPANTLAAYGFLMANCTAKDQSVNVQYVQGIGWTIPQTGDAFPHGPSPARNIWGMRGRQGDRVKLLYVPAGFDYADQPGGTATGTKYYWLIDFIEPRMTEAVYGLRINELEFQKQTSQIWGWSDVVTSGATWVEWATGEMCPPAGAEGRQPDGTNDGGAEGDCGCGGS